LVVGQPISFRGNEAYIRAQQLRKSLGVSFLLAYSPLLNVSSILSNAAILLVSYIGGPVAREALIFFGKKVDVDLPLDVKKIHGKFRCIWLYGFEMHSEQTNRHSSLYI
jgi:hypothetical protein